MSEDLQSRLEEAGKHFDAKAFDSCIRVLATCPADDVKVQHDMAVAEYVRKGGNHRDFAAKLNLPSAHAVVSARSGLPTKHLVLQFGGQEAAYLNLAAAQLHAGAVDEARIVLTHLAALPRASLSGALQVRLAMLLHLASRNSPSAVDLGETIAGLMDRSAIQANPALGKMVQLAFADTSGLHAWFTGCSKQPAERAMYYNNLGVEAFNDGRAQVAGMFFAKASDSTDDSMCLFLQQSILYNSGLCCLARGEYKHAVTALLASQKTMAGSPALWLRIAQALVQQYVAVAQVASNKSFRAAEMKQCQRVHDGVAPAFVAMPVATTGAVAEGAELLTTAKQALHNALTLLVERDEPIASAAQRLEGTAAGPQLQALLCNIAYVELVLGNHPLVVKYAADMLAVHAANPAAVDRRLFAAVTCYAVEAHCALNNPNAALRHLQAVDLAAVVAQGDESDLEALFVNLCVVHIMSGAWLKAADVAQHVVSKLEGKHAHLLLIYLQLAQGNNDAARAIAETQSVSPPA